MVTLICRTQRTICTCENGIRLELLRDFSYSTKGASMNVSFMLEIAVSHEDNSGPTLLGRL